jgi:putative transposase
MLAVSNDAMTVALRSMTAIGAGAPMASRSAANPQSNGMAEAFVRTIKRDYVRVSPRPNAKSVMRQLPSWITHYNEVHPHKALGYRSPREFIVAHERP